MSICKNCGAPVVWKQEPSGRWRCFNLGGVTDHWDACSRRRWQQVKSTGQRFERKDASGYARSIHGTKFDRISAGSILGAHYRVSGQCKDCVPPWEVCPACPDAIT